MTKGCGGCGLALGVAGLGVAVDSSGDAYLVGDTRSSNIPITADGYQSTSTSQFVPFVSLHP